MNICTHSTDDIPVHCTPEQEVVFRDVANKLNRLVKFLPNEIFDVHLGEITNIVYNPKHNGSDISFFTKYLTCEFSFNPTYNYHEGWGSDDSEDFRIRVANQPITVDDEHFPGGSPHAEIDNISFITNFSENERLYGKKSWEDFERRWPPQLWINDGKFYLFRSEIEDLAYRNGKIGPDDRFDHLAFICDVLRIMCPEIFPFHLYHKYSVEDRDAWKGIKYGIPTEISSCNEKLVTLGPLPVHDITREPSASNMMDYLRARTLFDVELCKKHSNHH